MTSVPSGYALHTENSAKILLPSETEAFLNPVQEFNRDLSIACITIWGDDLNKEKQARWKSRPPMGNKLSKGKQKAPMQTSGNASQETPSEIITDSPSKEAVFSPYKFTVLEPLAATGLRSIRYAQEIPLVRHVTANDLSSTAVAAMRKNIELNNLGPRVDSSSETMTEEMPSPHKHWDEDNRRLGKVRINEGDGCSLMYSHRQDKSRVDVIDLDPYGTAGPFIDAAVQCISDGGLLCITCTDLAVLATTNFPDKCFANYGGIPIKAEYSHEAALRLVLHAISSSAARYGRFITPLLSLSIDFYVRLFVRIQTRPIEVKNVFSKTACFYVCSNCQGFYPQYMGKVIDKPNHNGKQTIYYKTQAGPPANAKCDDCGSTLHFAGPMWAGPLHDTAFAKRVLAHVDQNPNKYGTATRMKGMLTVASEELDTFFYFTPTKIAGTFHSNCPPLDEVASALLHAGHDVSRSHACAGSLKTTATRTEIYDVFRCWIKENPVSMKNIKPGSPARVLLDKEPKLDANFAKHPKSVTSSASVKLVRYQVNPLPNWGPGSKPSKKRKRDEETEGQEELELTKRGKLNEGEVTDD